MMPHSVAELFPHDKRRDVQWRSNTDGFLGSGGYGRVRETALYRAGSGARTTTTTAMAVKQIAGAEEARRRVRDRNSEFLRRRVNPRLGVLGGRGFARLKCSAYGAEAKSSGSA